MEKIKVNMNPNPLDVQTIHASQNDGEARQWGFELHNNGDVIDSSEVTDQMVFKAYKGGTEQILPENGSTPTTSPFKGDIRYPQGLLTDQEFTYRQSPTEEDGLAKITDIKGNTLVWNQLSKANTEVRTSSGMTLQVVNGLLTISGTPTSSVIQIRMSFGNDKIPQGHKVLLSGKSNHFYFRLQGNTSATTVNDSVIFTTGSDVYNDLVLMGVNLDMSATYNESFYPQIFDLTQMGLDSITDPSDFTSLFPLPYYAYNQGTLLSFMGNGIKTVGKNRFYYPYTATSQTLSGVQCTIDTDGKITLNGTATSSFYINIFPNYPQNRVKQLKGTYTLGIGHTTIPNNFEFNFGVVINGVEYPSYGGRISSYNAKLTKDIPYDWEMFCNMRILQGASFDNFVIKPMLNFGNEALTFEPYTSSTLSLPISTYFPTGMKDVPDYTNGGKIYDELIPIKASTRIGAVDLGALNYTYTSSSQQFRSTTALQNAKLPSSSTDMVNGNSSLYNVTNYASISANDMVLTIVFSGSFAQGQVWIKNSNYTDVVAFKNAMSGVYLYYELATPTETSFTTASLVTENAEIPLSNNDGVLIGKCTEQLSENPGFIDAKIKLADSDGECYSNKIQLHVERSPQ